MKVIEKRCDSAEETLAFGEAVGKLLKGGEVIELRGDIGAGKTTFVRGLARGIDSDDHVSSPTFTVRNEYKGRIVLHHLDLYRLHEPGIVEHELSEILGLPDESVVIEWAETVENILPESRIVMQFVSPDEKLRLITVEVPHGLEYIEAAL